MIGIKKGKIIEIFISCPDTFTVLIGGTMFIIMAKIAGAPDLAIRGGIFGVAFGMLGGLWYNTIKDRLLKSKEKEINGD